MRTQALIAGMAIGIILAVLLYAHRDSCILCGKLSDFQQRMKERNEA
jgi:hypothetical protein